VLRLQAIGRAVCERVCRAAQPPAAPQVMTVSRRVAQTQPQATEAEALENAQVLIKYAAESLKDLPQNRVVEPIAAAWKARETGNWTPEVSVAFWAAYSEVCSTLKPMTLQVD
jgi:hypothetical protein